MILFFIYVLQFCYHNYSAVFKELLTAGSPPAANENDTPCHPERSEGSVTALSVQPGIVRFRRSTQGFLGVLRLGMTEKGV